MTDRANQTDVVTLCVLRACFELAARDQPVDLHAVAALLQVGVSRVRASARGLAARGLLSLPRLRLTMPGLAMAVRLPALASLSTAPREKSALSPSRSERQRVA